MNTIKVYVWSHAADTAIVHGNATQVLVLVMLLKFMVMPLKFIVMLIKFMAMPQSG